MQRVSTHPDFKFHPHCKQLALTHLKFADNLSMFGKVDPISIKHIKDALLSFSECAGLQANLNKSQMVLGGCSYDLQMQCLQAAEF